ncbi:MAG: SPOR domain-containing protein [Burkholderiaceae bacterium]|nr:SPOR domain-containing protein [Burkholderiaceae bacterium]
MIDRVNYPLGRQRGGTVVGIIIGLIIGLAIALVVAVAITKSSLPFMNKVAKQDKAPELTAGQMADPNKPLYGNNAAAKDAAKGMAPSAEGATPAAAGPATAPAAAGPVPAKPQQPIAALAAVAANGAANLAANAATKAEGDDKWIYYLQAGAFREQADAENSKAKLALAGFEASILNTPSDNGPLFKVRLGPFNQLEAMNRARGKLSDNGIDVAVVRIAK